MANPSKGSFPHVFNPARLGIILVIAVVILACSFSTVSVDPGEQAVLVRKPFVFGAGGVDPNPISTGRIFVWRSTDYFKVDIKPQAFKVSFDDFASKDNIILDLDTTAILRVTDSVKLISKFGDKWFDNSVAGPYSQMVRDVVKTQTMTDMMSNPLTATHMDQTVSDQLSNYLKTKGIPVEVISMTLGRAKPNPTVLDVINQTAAQEQRQKTEVASAAAEVARKDAETKRAEADNAYRQSLGYTPEQYVTLQIANIQAEACKAAHECILAPPGTSMTIHSEK